MAKKYFKISDKDKGDIVKYAYKLAYNISLANELGDTSLFDAWKEKLNPVIRKMNTQQMKDLKNMTKGHSKAYESFKKDVLTILDEIQKEMDEATTTASADGYNVPGAFSDNSEKDKKRKKKISTMLGMQLVGKVNESTVMIDDEDAPLGRFGYYKEFGDKGVGAFHPKTWRTDGNLVKLDSFDKKLVKDIKLKSDERIYRYSTDTTKAGNMMPLIKVNINKGLVYFLTPESSDKGETIEFEKKGVPTHWMRLRKSKINERKMTEDVTYDQAVHAANLQKKVEEYIKTNYSNEAPSLLGKRKGRDLPKGNQKEIIKFGKKKNDKELLKLIGDFTKYQSSIGTNENINEGRPTPMDETKLKKFYDSLKKGDTVSIKYSSVMGSNDPDEFRHFVVSKGKTKVGKAQVERITLKNPKNPNGVKYYLYFRSRVTFAIGDMAATVVDAKIGKHESVNEATFKDIPREIENLFNNKERHFAYHPDVKIIIGSLGGYTFTDGKREMVFTRPPETKQIKRLSIASNKTKELYQQQESVTEGKKPQPRQNRWLELKNDDTMHPNKKMAMGLKELKYQLAEVEKFLGWYNKIKNLNELESDSFWKRTNNHIYKIKERLVNIARTLKEIEK